VQGMEGSGRPADSPCVALCRHCGRDGLPLPEPFGVCDACANSPLCDRCGHPRGEHAQVFVRGVPPLCRWIVRDFQALTSAPCPCPGFRPTGGPPGEAEWAQPDDDPGSSLRLA